jgi:hypothetical protein
MKNKNEKDICQNCKSMTKLEDCGYCSLLECYTARKNTCGKFKRKKK